MGFSGSSGAWPSPRDHTDQSGETHVWKGALYCGRKEGVSGTTLPSFKVHGERESVMIGRSPSYPCSIRKNVIRYLHQGNAGQRERVELRQVFLILHVLFQCSLLTVCMEKYVNMVQEFLHPPVSFHLNTLALPKESFANRHTFSLSVTTAHTAAKIKLFAARKAWQPARRNTKWPLIPTWDNIQEAFFAKYEWSCKLLLFVQSSFSRCSSLLPVGGLKVE